jgi:hypothetical protein
MKKNGSIPRSDAAFDGFVLNVIQYVDLQCAGLKARWTHVPEEARTAQHDYYAAWYTAYAATKKPCTQPERAEKTRLHKVTEKALRNFYNIYLRYHPAVTDEDKENMGFHIPKKPGNIKPPETFPYFSIVQLGPRTLGIIFRDGAGGRKGSKPDNVEGARIHMGVFDEPPADQDALPASRWATRCPYIFHFREEDRGKRAYFALRWEIEKEHGEGPWSDILSEIIP